MKAAYYEGQEKIRIRECVPAPPAFGQAQLRVSCCGVCGTDLHIYRGKMDRRVTLPHVVDHEMAGTVEAVGPGVERLAIGDRVTVRPLDPCGT